MAAHAVSAACGSPAALLPERRHLTLSLRNLLLEIKPCDSELKGEGSRLKTLNLGGLGARLGFDGNLNVKSVILIRHHSGRS